MTRVIYSDDDGADMCFLSECSATITSYLGRFKVQHPAALDNTGRATWNESCRQYFTAVSARAEDGAGGAAPSTGARRTDW